MLKRHTVTLHHVITVFNDIVNHMDGVLCALAKKKTQTRKTYTLPWSFHTRSCPNIILKLVLWLVCFSFQHICLIVSGSCDRLGSGTRECLLILRTRHLILSNTRRHLWSMRRMNTAPNIDVCPSLNPTAYHSTIFLSSNGFQIWSIFLWSIWFVQRWWKILNA